MRITSRWFPILPVAAALPASADPAADSAARAAVGKGALGTYGGEPRGKDGHVDIDRLLRELADLRANVYHWLVWHADTDWTDLQAFLPRAREAGIRVWVTVVPPSESPPKTQRYSEPFRLDYVRWGEEIARLSLREPALVAWSVDDFVHNLKETFTPEKVKGILDAARAVNPKLAFVPCAYFKQITPEFAKAYGGLLDGVLFPYRNESVKADLKDPGQVEAEVKTIRERLGPGVPVILDVYATAHSRLGDSTPEYVRAVIEAGRRCADGVLIYCHQDPERSREKYGVIREAFRAEKR